ncbi:MAG: PVC-type heme-binding CxxCH protein [Verrucomicrobiales bacterium]
MTNQFRVFPIILATSSALLQGADVTPTAGKKSAEPIDFKSAEEYDKEAEVRIDSFTLPDDVSASLFVDPSQTQNPSAICFDHKGRLYIAEIHRWRAGVQDIRSEQHLLLDDIANETNEDRLDMYRRDQLSRPLSFYEEFSDRIVRVEDTDGDGRADKSSIWAEDFDDILDGPGIGLVAGAENEIYYTNIPHLWKLVDTDGDGKADERESLQDGFGVRMSLSGHDMHGIVWGPDGKLYWSIGDRGYSLTTDEGRHYHRPFTGGVFRCDPDGSNVEEIYSGLRNPQELAFDQYGNLFTCDNDADAWDTGRLVYILEGGDAGWHHGHQVLMNFRNQLELRTPNYEHPDHKTIPMNSWMTEGVWEPQHSERPAFALPPVDKVSWGPSGLVYNYGVTTMPSRYAEHFWVCNFGGAKGDLEAFSVKPDGAGFALDHHEVFMVGLGNTDVEFGPDGRMYLSCFNNNGWFKQDIGNVYALSGESGADSDLLKETRHLLTEDFPSLVESELARLLGHPDMRVRQRAQFDLVRRGSRDVFLEALRQKENRLKRLHGIWGLGQLARKDEELLREHIELLSDSDGEVRAQAATVLSDSRTEAAGEALVAALDDESARVRSFAAIGVGKCGNANALPKLIEMLAENDDEDVFLRHALVQGLWYLNDRQYILRQSRHESAAVRLGVLLTLRKLLDPRVKYFLDDSDEFIRHEAIRAINDLNLVTALPDLAEEIVPYAEAAEGLRFPKGHRDWILHTRLLNANFRVGEVENARNVLAYAAQPKLPALLREQALRAILEWPTPHPVDATTGRFRPLDSASRIDITEAVEAELPAVFDKAEGNLVGLATRIALTYGVEAPVELLTEQITDEDAKIDARVDSLQGLAKQEPAALGPLWDSLLKSERPRFRAAVVEQLIEVDRVRGISEAVELANSKELRLRQHGYRLLGAVDDPAAVEIFRERLANRENEMPGALLDLLESAAQQEDDEVAALLAEYEDSLDDADPVAAFRPTLEGGDVDRGQQIFMTHAAGQCAKCHKIDGDGGVAGPELDGIGSRHDNAYILESLVAPSEVIVPGYGLTMVSLKNGESIGGALVSEDSSSITLKVPDSENSAVQTEKKIPLSEIESRQPPVSAMPPVVLLLQKSEIRNLVAYLASLEEKNGK